MQSNMNDDVKVLIKKKADDMCIAQWLLVEMILEEALNIDNSQYDDVATWFGKAHSKSRTGKPLKNKRK